MTSRMRSPRSASAGLLGDDERVGGDAGEDAPGEEVLISLGSELSMKMAMDACVSP